MCSLVYLPAQSILSVYQAWLEPQKHTLQFLLCFIDITKYISSSFIVSFITPIKYHRIRFVLLFVNYSKFIVSSRIKTYNKKINNQQYKTILWNFNPPIERYHSKNKHIVSFDVFYSWFFKPFFCFHSLFNISSKFCNSSTV